MKIIQEENFYNYDAKDYELEKNKEFFIWLKSSISNGYHCYMGIEELQELIDNIANWYELKYPEREFDSHIGIIHLNFEDIKEISDVMDIRQLFYRLPHKQLCIMECGYRAKSGGQRPIYENGKKVGFKPQIYIKTIIKNEKYDPWANEIPFFYLQADCMTGEVLKDYKSKDYLNFKENLTLDELLEKFKEKYPDELDFTNLKECVYDHDCDMELRHRILQLVALKLLYSRNTTPIRGYERAKRFIDEFNNELGLTLSTKEIDEIINRHYNINKNEEKILVIKDNPIEERKPNATYDKITPIESRKYVRKLIKKAEEQNKR